MDIRNYFTDPCPLPNRPIKHVFELWVSPMLPEVNGEWSIPTIHRDDFDHSRVGRLLGDIFYGSACQILVPNDWIDPVAFNTALDVDGVVTVASIFEDYRRVVSRNSSKHSSGVIDVRSVKSWQRLKEDGVLDDGFIYPPSVIPFCVSFRCMDDLWHWVRHSKHQFGYGPYADMDRIWKGRAPAKRPVNDQGVLPVWVLKELKDIFGVWFDTKVRIGHGRL